ncbi:hypothetical protein [Bythopirellula goksoeyrii]|uniref:Uncharacterized protein n=1 Tax=Bythopirellula goksoeyrii TaxID=1400387 RepID=A0A5B9Q7X0_9BACT|nr:hypothetical protein [Bythopirellula goksoeyrii]QEG35117.1 hypothetical protein Pr1d_24080 [Bythopirellula goksoeyrii]
MIDLVSITAKLRTIEKAGLLPELEHELSHQRRQIPDDPFQADPWLRCNADYLARTTSRITGESLYRCRNAAVEVLANTKASHAAKLIDRFYQRVSGRRQAL